MYIASWTKLVVVVLLIISASVLAALRVFSSAEAQVILAAVLGYVFGNAHGVISAGGGQEIK